jgi:hypothetical protein
LGPRVASIKVVNKACNKRASLAELLFELSKSNNKLYYVFSLSLVYLLEHSLSEELEEEESSN